MTWQSIDTAPRDGTTILGWDGQGMAVVRWSAGCLEAWQLAVCGTYAIDGDWDPTHWQPLPDHPPLPEEK